MKQGPIYQPEQCSYEFIESETSFTGAARVYSKRDPRPENRNRHRPIPNTEAISDGEPHANENLLFSMQSH